MAYSPKNFGTTMAMHQLEKTLPVDFSKIVFSHYNLIFLQAKYVGVGYLLLLSTVPVSETKQSLHPCEFLQ